MPQIYQTNNFIVEAPDKPHVTRTDGGHVKIYPKVRLSDRTQLSAKLATEVMRLTMLIGEAMTKGLNNQGIDVGRINYQDNGNWSVFKPEGPYFHIHLYGRAKSAKYHKYGEACHFPLRSSNPEFYERFQPLNSDDVLAIQKEIEKLEKTEKYDIGNWGL